MSPSAPSAARTLRFDSFELDLHAGELRKGGTKLRLQGQPLQVLAILLQSAGNLVTREELRSQIWQVDTFVDFDHSLHNAIARVREVLGDSAQTPKYIETLPRRGYRFIAAVEEVQPASTFAESGDEAIGAVVTAGSPGARFRRRTIFILALGACCVAGFAAWMAWRLHQASAVPGPRSIAVLPLQNLSGDASQEYFADGLTDQLITELSQIPELRVISHTSVTEYKGTTKHLPQIARELKVDDIVEGSVVREGDQVRVTVQLLDAPNDRHIWSEDYQRPVRSILTLQRNIAQAIAQQVRIKLTPRLRARLGTARAVDPAAYEAFLRGRYYLMSQFSRPQPLNTARRYFEDAIRKDPDFALAYAGWADATLNLATFRHLAPQSAYDSAKTAVHKALDLDGSSGEAHIVNAMFKWNYEWDWADAERESNYAIALSPSYDCARAYHALFLAWSNRREEALAEITKARELNPGSSFSTTESAVYYLLRDYPNLIEASRRGIASDPNEWLERQFLGVGYEASGRRAEAIPEYQRAVEMSSGDQDPAAALAHAYAMQGRRSEAEKILLDLQRKSKESYVSPYMLATIYAGLGEKDKAFDLLEQAYRERCMDLAWSLKADPRIDNLRSDPRFQSLVWRVGLPQ